MLRFKVWPRKKQWTKYYHYIQVLFRSMWSFWSSCVIPSSDKSLKCWEDLTGNVNMYDSMASGRPHLLRRIMWYNRLMDFVESLLWNQIKYHIMRLCHTWTFSQLIIRPLSSWSVITRFHYSCFSSSVRYDFTNWMPFTSEMLIIGLFMRDKAQFEAHVRASVHGRNGLRCAGACLVLRSRCVALSCVL